MASSLASSDFKNSLYSSSPPLFAAPVYSPLTPATMALGNVGKFVLSDMVERLVAGVNGEYTGAAKSGGEDEYREFLKSELARLDAKKEKQD